MNSTKQHLSYIKKTKLYVEKLSKLMINDLDFDYLLLIDKFHPKYIHWKGLIDNANVPFHLKCVLNNSASSFDINSLLRQQHPFFNNCMPEFSEDT